MNRTKRIVLICICSLLIIATMVAMVFAVINYYGGKNKTYAEFTDIANDSVVNFNQLINNGNFTNISAWSSNAEASYTTQNNIATISISSGSSKGIFQTFKYAQNHIYYARGYLKLDTTPTYNCKLQLNMGTAYNAFCNTTDWTKCEIYQTANTS